MEASWGGFDGRCERQPNDKGAPPARLATNIDPSAVPLDDREADRQSEAQPTRIHRVDDRAPVVRLKYSILLVLRYARSVVDDRYPGVIAVSLGLYPDDPIRWRVLHGVGNQVEETLLQSPYVISTRQAFGRNDLEHVVRGSDFILDAPDDA